MVYDVTWSGGWDEAADEWTGPACCLGACETEEEAALLAYQERRRILPLRGGVVRYRRREEVSAEGLAPANLAYWWGECSPGERQAFIEGLFPGRTPAA